MIELVSQPEAPPATTWWCAHCAATCILGDDGDACAQCGGPLIEQLPEAWSQSSAVCVVADFHRQEGVDLEDAAGALLPLIRTPEDLIRWLAVVVSSPGAELECAVHVDPENELQDLAQHLLSQLGDSEARLGRLEAWIREQALVAGLPLVVTTAAGRVLELSPQELVLALGEAAARGREAPTPAPLVGTLTLTHGLEALAAYEAGAPASPADPTADALRDLQAEVDGLSVEVKGHQAAARRAVGLLQRTAAALRALDAEVQASSWRGAELQLGGPLSDQTLRGLADHLEGELRRVQR